MNKTVLSILAVVVVVVVAGVGSMYWSSMNKPEKSDRGVDKGGIEGLRIENSTDGNWIITFASASEPLKNVRFTISNSSTGERTVDKRMSDLLPAKNDPDAVFNDTNANNKIDSGDSILLKGSSPNIKSGYRVQFLKDNNVIAQIGEIP
jgi:hypothetical protein